MALLAEDISHYTLKLAFGRIMEAIRFRVSLVKFWPFTTGNHFLRCYTTCHKVNYKKRASKYFSSAIPVG